MPERPTAGQMFLDLFKESVIIQSLITLIVLSVPAYRLITAGTMEGIPEFWTGLTTLVIGYWFGAKGSFQAVRANRETLKALEHTTTMLAARSGPGSA